MAGAGAAVVVLSGMAAVQDLLSRTIANGLSIAIALLFVAVAGAAVATGTGDAADVGWRVAAAVAVFAVATVLFALNMLGGGDVKLLGSVTLWVAPGALPAFLLVVVLAGGAISAAMIAVRVLRKFFFENQRFAPICFTSDKEHGHTVPYGLAIAAGVLVAWLEGAVGPLAPTTTG